MAIELSKTAQKIVAFLKLYDVSIDVPEVFGRGEVSVEYEDFADALAEHLRAPTP